MSWAEAKNIKDTLADKMSDLANATLHINLGQTFAGKNLMLKRYDKDYMEVTTDTQGVAEVSVQPRSRYELVDTDEANTITSNVFFVNAGEYKEVAWAMNSTDGDTATPIDDVRMLLTCAGVAHLYSYNTVADVLKDGVCLTAVCTSVNGMKYLLRSHSLLNNFIHDTNFLDKIGACKKTRYLCAMDANFCNILCTNPLYWDEAIRVFPVTMSRLAAGQSGLEIICGDDVYKFSINPNVVGVNSNLFDGSAPGTGSSEDAWRGATTLLGITIKYGSRHFIPKLLRVIYGATVTNGSNPSTSLSGTNATTGDTITGIAASGAISGGASKAYGNYANNVTAVDTLNIAITGYSHSGGWLTIGEIEVLGVWEEDAEGI